MNLQPLGNFVFIEADEKVKMTEAGIQIPDVGSQAAILKGTVIAVGPGELVQHETGWLQKPMSLKVGDRVLFRRQRFEEFEDADKKKIWFGSEDNVWSKIANESKKD